MAGTTAFAVKQALFDKIRSIPALADYLDNIYYSFTAQISERPRLAVHLGEIAWESVWDDEFSPTIGANTREESYNILVLIESHGPGNDQAAANEEIRVIVQEIEAMLKNPRWSGQDIVSSGFSPLSVAEGGDAEGRGAIMLARVRIKARK